MDTKSHILGGIISRNPVWHVNAIVLITIGVIYLPILGSTKPLPGPVVDIHLCHYTEVSCTKFRTNSELGSP